MAQVSRAVAERIMNDTGWLPRVPEGFRAEVLRRSILMHFSAGEVIYRVGDPPGGLYGLVSGTIGINMADAGALPRLVMLGIPGHWTGEGGFLTRTPRRIDLRAVVETNVFHLPLDVLDQMAARDPDVVHHIATLLVVSVEFLMRMVHDLQVPEVDRRIASVLHRTSWIGEVPIPLSQAELGVMANASRKQVNAALKRFTEAGWLQHSYRTITVTDVSALRRFAEGDGVD